MAGIRCILPSGKNPWPDDFLPFVKLLFQHKEQMKKHILIMGAGLGGLATALRLVKSGFEVTIVEKNAQAGGRLNRLSMDGFHFDLGPSFLSMSYELKELFASCREPFPYELQSVDPLYQVYFSHHDHPFRVSRDLQALATEFSGIEPDLEEKARRYLHKAREFFVDTESRVVKTNFHGLADYLLKLSRVPVRHLPYLFKNMWEQTGGYFDSQELRVIFCLVAFFLGSTPFQTPSIYSLLNYVEFEHDGYWIVKGGMYSLVTELVRILERCGVRFEYHADITALRTQGQRVIACEDQRGRVWEADVFVCNADAAAFRGQILKRKRYAPSRLDKMDWSMAPFTVYLGVDGRTEGMLYHNYFLGSHFADYANTIFKSTIAPENPYYYVNILSQVYDGCAPDGCESVFILCPVPDLRFKSRWEDKEAFADQIVADLSQRTGFDFQGRTRVRTVLSPEDWQDMFHLYRGSGLGLAHGFRQIGALRPANHDEILSNLFYVGASTLPGTGLPMVIIGSKLVQERILREHGTVS